MQSLYKSLIIRVGSESSTLLLVMGSKVPHHFRSRELKFQGAPGAEVPPMELSLPGAKVHGNESSIIRLKHAGAFKGMPLSQLK